MDAVAPQHLQRKIPDVPMTAETELLARICKEPFDEAAKAGRHFLLSIISTIIEIRPLLAHVNTIFPR
jgi:hypothetical protein